MVKKVVFFTEGSSYIGFGHIGRCGALAQAVKTLGGEPSFVVSADEAAENFLKTLKIPYKVFDRPLSGLEPADFEADAAVIDSYLADLAFYRRAVEVFKKVLFVDDYLRLDYPEGGTLLNYVPAFEVPERFKNHLVGEKYHLLRKPFWEIPERPIRKEVSRVLITFGGDDLRNMTPKVAKLILDNFKRIKLDIVVGGGFKRVDLLEDLVSAYPQRVSLYRSLPAEGMKNLMLSADLVVSAGGQTLFELAACGTPTLAVGVAENQRPNLEGFTERGFLEGFLWWDLPDFGNLFLENFEKLLDRNKRKRLSERGRKLIDGKGALRVAEFLLSD